MGIFRAVWSFLLSAGIMGSAFAFFLRRLAAGAEREAERRRAVKYRSELLRLEGEDCLAALILAVAEYCRGGRIGEEELAGFEEKYKVYLAKSRAFGAELYADIASREIGRKR